MDFSGLLFVKRSASNEYLIVDVYVSFKLLLEETL